jgi:hypothetical protein
MAFTQTTERINVDTNPRFLFGNFLVLIPTNLPTAMTAISVVLFSLPPNFGSCLDTDSDHFLPNPHLCTILDSSSEPIHFIQAP